MLTPISVQTRYFDSLSLYENGAANLLFLFHHITSGQSCIPVRVEALKVWKANMAILALAFFPHLSSLANGVFSAILVHATVVEAVVMRVRVIVYEVDNIMVDGEIGVMVDAFVALSWTLCFSYTSFETFLMGYADVTIITGALPRLHVLTDGVLPADVITALNPYKIRNRRS